MIHITLHITLADGGRETYEPTEWLPETTVRSDIETAVRRLLAQLLYDWQDCTCLMHHYRNGRNTHNDFFRIGTGGQ